MKVGPPTCWRTHEKEQGRARSRGHEGSCTQTKQLQQKYVHDFYFFIVFVCHTEARCKRPAFCERSVAPTRVFSSSISSGFFPLVFIAIWVPAHPCLADFRCFWIARLLTLSRAFHQTNVAACAVGNELVRAAVLCKTQLARTGGVLYLRGWLEVVRIRRQTGVPVCLYDKTLFERWYMITVSHSCHLVDL